MYPSDHISLLASFDHLVGSAINCVMVFNDAALNWTSWSYPWFLQTYSDSLWGAWATTPGTHRQLIITQDLVPASERAGNWLRRGAEGQFARYARLLATNLVRAGLSHSIIRLAPEANGTWKYDSVPNTPAGDAQWIRFWRNTVLAMRSVAGAHFRFDWTISAITRDLPLSSFYPGNDVVNIIGIDLYDSLVPRQSNRWDALYNYPDSVRQVEQFAVRHNKPLSFPEWGLEPNIGGGNGGGDDPSFIQGLAHTIRNARVAYQSYFFSGPEMLQLINAPRSIVAYRSAFGPLGSTSRFGASARLPALVVPNIRVLAGPGNGSSLHTSTIRFVFRAARGFKLSCSLDGVWRRCSGPTSDLLRHLRPGYHEWLVQTVDPASRKLALSGRSFFIRR